MTARAFVIKAEVPNPRARVFLFRDQKTMYGGKLIAAGDTVYMFASETQGGRGLFACGVVTAVTPTPRLPGVARQAPRVSVAVRRTALAVRPMGRRELKPFAGRGVGRAEGELHFKFYRQATNKIGGISDRAAALLRACF